MLKVTLSRTPCRSARVECRPVRRFVHLDPVARRKATNEFQAARHKFNEEAHNLRVQYRSEYEAEQARKQAEFAARAEAMLKEQQIKSAQKAIEDAQRLALRAQQYRQMREIKAHQSQNRAKRYATAKEVDRLEKLQYLHDLQHDSQFWLSEQNLDKIITPEFVAGPELPLESASVEHITYGDEDDDVMIANVDAELITIARRNPQLAEMVDAQQLEAEWKLRRSPEWKAAQRAEDDAEFAKEVAEIKANVHGRDDEPTFEKTQVDEEDLIRGDLSELGPDPPKKKAFKFAAKPGKPVRAVSAAPAAATPRQPVDTDEGNLSDYDSDADVELSEDAKTERDFFRSRQAGLEQIQSLLEDEKSIRRVHQDMKQLISQLHFHLKEMGITGETSDSASDNKKK